MVKLPKQPSFLYLGVSFEPGDFFKSQYPQGFDHEIFFWLLLASMLLIPTGFYIPDSMHK